MISWIIRRFVGKQEEQDPGGVRYAVCRLLGYVGIVLNLLLFAAKFSIGVLVGSVAIKGDAINNLTDFMSNFISILSFKLAQKPADKEHPYGHERTETIAALFMGMLIVYLGFEMAGQSIDKLLHPGPVHFEWAAVAVLVISIVVKLYMYAYNHKYGRVYDSDLLDANAIDSRNDVIGTSLVLASSLLSPVLHYDLDGIVGLVVSGIIFVSAWGLLKEVISALLGEAPSVQTVNELTDRILENPMVIDVHDIAIHSYGPRSTYATAHVEVDADLSLSCAHAQADHIERAIAKAMNIDLVIHVDPIKLDDDQTDKAQEELEAAIRAIAPDWSCQDFRIDEGPDHRKGLYFDLVVPYEEERTREEIEKLIYAQLTSLKGCVLQMRLVHPIS